MSNSIKQLKIAKNTLSLKERKTSPQRSSIQNSKTTQQSRFKSRSPKLKFSLDQIATQKLYQMDDFSRSIKYHFHRQGGKDRFNNYNKFDENYDSMRMQENLKRREIF